jgi:CTP:molybdopterin cytidylyltransferase MocA
MHRVAAILLAAGLSRRFGPEDKLLYAFNGKALARHTLDLVRRLGCFHPIVYVTARPEVAALAPAMEAGSSVDIRVVHNSRPQYGIGESVRLGVAAAGEADYYAFFPCDMPLLDAATVETILAHAAPGKIVRPIHRGRPGNPCIFAADFREVLVSLSVGEQPRDIQKRRPECIVSVEIANGAALSDIDRLRDVADIERISDSGFKT